MFMFLMFVMNAVAFGIELCMLGPIWNFGGHWVHTLPRTETVETQRRFGIAESAWGYSYEPSQILG